MPTQERSSASRMRNAETSQCHRGTDFSKTERSIPVKAEWAADSRWWLCVARGRGGSIQIPQKFQLKEKVDKGVEMETGGE